MSETDYYAMTMPGLETVAFDEIRAQIAGAQLVKFARGVVIFQAPASPAELLKLRTTEDVFVQVAHVTKLSRVAGALRVLHSATLRADVTAALAQWRRVHAGSRKVRGQSGASDVAPRTWRVVSQMEGDHEFRRIDAGKAVSDALRHILPKEMRAVPDDADVEFWLWLHGSEALIGLRLSDATMRHRQYKREHLPASLRPTVAASLAWLSQPTPTDVVLDPLCGAGTILVERCLLAPADRVLGGDLRANAVEVARRNARAAGTGPSGSVTLDLRVWDATRLPLSDASVTRIITNLPFGKQIGAPEDNAQLYPALAREFARVITPDGLIVAITSADRLWEASLRECGWQVIKKVVVVVLGQPASIFVARRAQGATGGSH
jgi:tRNA (guanine6-N2)-methyltransferase